ncbi:ABC transporter permease [Streptococcus pantholopis]|uniref:ABC transporter permease n=1 Tax=Streptococcus pantholopis TaxID=1811193 RepID=A0A172Q6J2_9STRE|nr:ABC transporter permease [Streptococcus pantholopis]AND79015.1 ABC transporter permease [Streptococcus pantholopis]
MMNKLRSLLWLRWQFLLSNKLFMFMVLTPPFYVLLLSTIGDSSVTAAYIGTGINTVYSITAGSFISMMIAEEKEKKNLKTLILTGVNQKEYILSVILFPICFSLAASILLPLLLHVRNMDWGKFLLVVGLTIVIFVLLNLLIAFLAKNQMQASLFSLSLYLLANFLPILAAEIKWLKNVLDWSFIGANSKYFSQLADFELTDPSLLALVLWILLAGTALYFAYKRNRKLT